MERACKKNVFARCALLAAWLAGAAAHGVSGGVPPCLYDQAEPYDLPALMRTRAGEKVLSSRQWEETRRPEILAFAVRHIYGVRPVEKPEDLRFAPLGDDKRFADCGAVRKRFEASFSGPYGAWRFPFDVFLPEEASAENPVAAFLLICNHVRYGQIDLDLKHDSEMFPVREIVKRGYAAIIFKNTDLALDAYYPREAPDGTAVVQDPPFTNGFYACWAPARTERSWGAISVWAWGASRILDWIEGSGVVNPRRVAVVGHSRGGKTSLWAAACDTRFAMACVNNSGCCGAKLNHVEVPLSETIQQDNNNNPHWFARAFRAFNGQDRKIPYDQHWLAALVAPRLLYIASSSLDHGAGPWGEFLTARHASPAWALYGVKGLVEDGPYRIGKMYHQGHVAYHLKKGKHSLTRVDWHAFMDFADRHGWRKK